MLLLRPEEIEILQELPPGQLYARVRLEQVLGIYSYKLQCSVEDLKKGQNGIFKVDHGLLLLELLSHQKCVHFVSL